MKKFVPAFRAYFPEEDREWIASELKEILKTGQLTLGKWGKSLEEAWGSLAGSPHAVAVNSGTSAIEIPLRILGVEGKEVLVPTNTFFATAAAVVHAGGRPVFVDIEPEDMAASLESLEKSLTPRTAGVIWVHIAGLVSPRVEEARKWCDKKGLWLFEDAAHAHGSSWNGKHAGTFGIAGSFSFYPTKVMTAGEGGLIVTGEKRIDEEARLYRDQGKTSFLENTHGKMGYNWRLSEPNALIGFSQTRRLSEINEKRNRIAGFYNEALQGLSFGKPLAVPKGSVCNYYKYVFIPNRPFDRKGLKKKLKEDFGVCLTGEVYETPLHQQPVFQRFAGGSFPAAEDLCGRHICLPLYPDLTTEEAGQVIESLKEVFHG